MNWNYYILFNYKSTLKAIVSNFSHSSMITPRPLLRVIISVLVLSIESVSVLGNGRFNGIPFHYQFKRSTN